MLQHWPIKPLLTPETSTPDAWLSRASATRALFLKTLGEKPASQHFRSYKTLDSIALDSLTLHRVSIQVDSDESMEAFVILPQKPNGKAALAMHQTTDHGKDEVAGLAGLPDLHYGKELALRGWTVVAPDLFAITRRLPPGLKSFDSAGLYQRFPTWSAVGKTVSDLQATLDFMQQHPATQSLPISTIGHSLGGHSVMFLSALDPRPVRYVCNAGLYPFSDSANRAHFFRDHWYIYLKDQALKHSVVHGPQPLWDMHEVVALAAPRPAMIIAAGNDEGIQSHTGLALMTDQIHKLYGMLAPKHSFSAILHNDGHSFLPWHRAAAYQWLES